MASTVRLTTAQAVVRFLAAQYVLDENGRRVPWVRGILGIFGHGNLNGLGQAIASEGRLEFVQGHNEQGMVHTAVAYAKQLRRRRIWAVTTSIGPGATNLVTGAALATINRIPVLLLPGETFASREPDPVLQQLEDPVSHMRTVNDSLFAVSRYFDRVERPEQLMAALRHAAAVLTDPARMGAVTLAIPQDVQCEAFDFPEALFAERVLDLPRPTPSPEEVEAAAESVVRMERPFLIVGGGVRYAGAEAEVQAFAETFGVPFGETQAGKGAIVSDHPWNMGGVGVTGTEVANRLAHEADGIVAVGTRLTDFTTASRTAFGAEVPVVHVNVVRDDATKLDGKAVAADAARGLAALRKALATRGYHTRYTVEEVARRKAAWQEEAERWFQAASLEPGMLAQTRVLGELATLLPDDAVVVNAAGSLPGDLHRLWPVRASGGYHMEYGYSCMGYEVAGALGAKLAYPEREVWALVGDGSFLLLHSELATALELGVKIVVVVFNNGGFASIRSLQAEHGGQAFGNEFRRQVPGRGPLGERVHVNFARIAEGLGAMGLRANTTESLREAVREARSAERSVVIDVVTAIETQTHGYDAFWYVPTAEVGAGEAANATREQDRLRMTAARRW